MVEGSWGPKFGSQAEITAAMTPDDVGSVAALIENEEQRESLSGSGAHDGEKLSDGVTAYVVEMIRVQMMNAIYENDHDYCWLEYADHQQQRYDE